MQSARTRLVVLKGWDFNQREIEIPLPLDSSLVTFCLNRKSLARGRNISNPRPARRRNIPSSPSRSNPHPPDRGGGKPIPLPPHRRAAGQIPSKLYTEMPQAVEKIILMKTHAKVSLQGAGNVSETPSATGRHPDKTGKKVMKFLQNGLFTPILRFCYTSVQAVDFGGWVWYYTCRGKGSYTGLIALKSSQNLKIWVKSPKNDPKR